MFLGKILIAGTIYLIRSMEKVEEYAGGNRQPCVVEDE